MLALTSVLVGAACSPQASSSSDWTVIFEQEPWYRSRSELERAWTGTLRRRDVIAGPHARTALRYSVITDRDAIGVYAPTDRLESFVDGIVIIRGKLIDLSSEGFGTELWPGSIARVR